MDITEIIRQGAQNIWILMPMAMLLGALHGLEPGHSKTMMAAFVVAIRGTWVHALVLGLCTTISHTLIVWIIALGGLYFGEKVTSNYEPILHIVAALMMIGIGAWMIWQIYSAKAKSSHDHDHDHDHDHSHEPHDAHAAFHAKEIARQFGDGNASWGQIIAFGLTGGLLPCPSSITVLLLCLQLKKITLGVWLVFGFSIGLALTLVSVGVAASLALSGLRKRTNKCDKLLHYAPMASAIVIMILGLIMLINSI